MSYKVPVQYIGPPPGMGEFKPSPIKTQTEEDKEFSQFYRRAAWRNLRALKLTKNPLCEICESRDKIEPATQVHHILGRRERRDLELTYSNLQSLCHTCHSAITGNERKWQNKNSNQ